MSIEMEEAFTKDMAEIKENGDYEYIENDIVIEQNQDIIEEAKEEVIQENNELVETEEYEDPFLQK